ITNNSLKQLFNTPPLAVDGKFSKNMVTMILAIGDTLRGEDVSIDIKPIKQISPVGCYMTAEAMFFNSVHQKDGTPDAYTEFDTRARINSADLGKDSIYIGALAENSKGRLTVSRSKGIGMVN